MPAVESLLSREALTLLERAARTPSDPDDPDAIDMALIRAMVPVVARFLTAWFRMEVEGMDRVPPGPAIIVGNHNAGVSFYEAVGLGARWYMEHGYEDRWYGLAHDWLMIMPFLGNLLPKIGGIRASHANAHAVFARGHKVIVFPGGNFEAFRPYSLRNRIRFGDHTGFVRLALKARVPIVPAVTIGGHEGFVVLRDGQHLARALRLDRLFRTPAWPLFLGLPWGVALGPICHLPLPTKVRWRFLDPIHLDAYPPEAADDPEIVAHLQQQVVDSMQLCLDEMAAERRWPVIG